MIQRPLVTILEAKQRKLDTSATEAWWGLLRCWRGLRRWGQAAPGSRARRPALRGRLVEQVSALSFEAAVTDEPALRNGSVSQWIGLAIRSSPLCNWFESLLEAEVRARRRSDSAARAKSWRDFCSTALGGDGRVAHRLIKEKRGEAPPVVAPDDERQLPRVGSAAAEAILDEWLAVWDKPSRACEQPAASWEGPSDLAPITVAQVRDVARRFPVQTGLGWATYTRGRCRSCLTCCWSASWPS